MIIALIITFGVVYIATIALFAVVLNEVLDKAYQERNNLYNRIQTPNAAEAQLLSFPKPEQPPSNEFKVDTDVVDGLTLERTGK